jgi:hypothetical protein
MPILGPIAPLQKQATAGIRFRDPHDDASTGHRSWWA